MKYLFALLLSSLIIGCASMSAVGEDNYCPSVTDKSNLECFETVLITVYAEDSFSQSRKLDIAMALSEWSIRTDNRVRFDLIFVPQSVLKRSTDVNNTYFVFNKAPDDPKYDGFCVWREKIGAFIELSPAMSDKIFEPVALHEFGHALGLKHYEGSEPAIMHPNLRNGFDVACQDLAAFCDIWGCGANECTKNEIPDAGVSNDIKDVSEPLAEEAKCPNSLD